MHDGGEGFLQCFKNARLGREFPAEEAALSPSKTDDAIRDPTCSGRIREGRPPSAWRDGMGRVQMPEVGRGRVLLALHRGRASAGRRSAKKRRRAPGTSAYHLGNVGRKSAPGELRIRARFLENSLSGRGFFRMLASGRSRDISACDHTNKY